MTLELEKNTSCCCSKQKPKDKEKLQSYNLSFKEKIVYKLAEAIAKYLNLSPKNTERTWWFSNYAFNNLPIIGLKHFNIFGYFKSQPFPYNQVSHVAGGIVHALIGANPRCENDQELYTAKSSYYHGLNFAVGYASCIGAGFAYNYLRPVIADQMYNNPFMCLANEDPAAITNFANMATSFANLAFLTFIEGNIMCKIEKTVLEGYKLEGNIIGTVKHVSCAPISYIKEKILELPQKIIDFPHDLSKRLGSWADYIKGDSKSQHDRAR